MSDGASLRAFRSVAADGSARPLERMVAEERPVALEYNGIGYAVLMATPADLEDLAIGFSLTERLIEEAGQILDSSTHETPDGMLLRMTLADECAGRVVDRVRHRITEGSCGLCGIENLEQAIRPLPKLSVRTHADEQAIFRALGELQALQPLSELTGAVHAAALCDDGGKIRLVREDVGRHNAFDKLIGAMRRSGQDWSGGFALLSSRCSYELIEKAVLAQCPMLVTISAPTALAMQRARAAGLVLVVLAREDAMLVVPGDQGV
jgi:FdhD protein